MGLDLRARLEAALDEDLGPGDLTTEATIPEGARGRGEIVAKEALVVSGQRVVRLAFEVAAARLGHGSASFVAYQPEVADGTAVAAGTVIGRVSGDLRAILVGERLALNLLMLLCGVATHTAAVLRAAGPATFKLVDTRKTTPLWRDLEKAAVVHGGGANHRFGLFDGVLIKDNHIAGAGGVAAAVDAARARAHHLVRVEVEVSTLDELEEALEAGAEGVLLDNMDDDLLVAAVGRVADHEARTGRHVFTEASGNMTGERLARIAAIGLDLVSMGGLIHQARWADLSLRVARA